MAAYDLEEQEQLATIKAWWDKWGNLITGVLVVCAVAAIGWRGWGWYQDRRANEASVAYAALTEAIRKNDTGAVKAVATRLETEYANTAQAALGSLLAAKFSADNNDSAAATAQLQFVIEKTSNPLLRDAARLRLAAVQADTKAYDQAIGTLDVAPDSSFQVRFFDLKGDILVAKGVVAEARKAYQSALDAIAKNPESDQLKDIIQTKLDALGEA